jgi:hypothetical protein
MGVLDTGLFDSVKNLLAQYAPGKGPTGDAGAHFEEVAASVDPATLAGGITAAMRSPETPPFAEIVSRLYASGTPDQRAAMLKTLLASASPEQRAQLAASISGGTALTPDQARTLSPSDVQSMATQAERHDPGVLEKMGAMYAAHPALVRTLGTAAMMIAMRSIANRQADHP